ncbi:DUF397 domain-containing protein [Amycolatopsis balhimycina DSM 5908]|uniref:DUF397 domain-containing protein n=1 Tax=Amycolatopsis balhimycina DSM 5908 TaxID=1081091 RepID=A0A428VYY2_AMYBA|nr:DUF397 domain-containing protein [Amycolatopsis balhimycina]RSM36032.1 DUF397 domain-containing protein [Amycolatopsis balhimycina DSM 5908]
MTNSTGWFKSSWSSETADCVEVRLGDDVGVRDSKAPSDGQLAVDQVAWGAFLERLTKA